MTFEELKSAACAYSVDGQRTSQGVPLNNKERAKLAKVAKHFDMKPVRAIRLLILKAAQEVENDRTS